MKQSISGTFLGGTFRIPDNAASIIPPGGHAVIGAFNYSKAGSVSGAFDILVSPSDACEYSPSGAFTPYLTLPNSEGWVALYDPNGEPLDMVYWSSAASNITNVADINFNPGGVICVPAGTPPTTPLKNAYEINQTKPCIVSFIGNSSPFWANRITDGASTWTFQAGGFSAGGLLNNYSIKAGYPNAGGPSGNCNGGSCRTSLPAGPAKPSIGTITAVTSCPNNGSVVITGLPTSYTGGNGNTCSGSGNWTITASPSGISYTGNTSSFTATGLGAGTTTFTVTDFGGCSSVASDAVIVPGIVCCPVISNTTSSFNTCINGSMPPLFANTTQPDDVKFIYSTTQLSGTAIYSSGTALSGTITPVSGSINYAGGALGTAGSLPNTAGSYYVYCILANPPADLSCRPFLEYTITIDQNPTIANAGPDQTGVATCNATQVTLAANNPSIGTGSWSILSGLGGSITTPNSPTSTFNGTAGSAYVLRWTTTNGTCSASVDDIAITFNQNPTPANAGADQTGSSTCGQTTVTLAANTPTIGSGQWSIINGTGGSFSNVNNPTSTFSGTAGSTYTLRWTTTNGVICAASTDEVIVTFNQNPTTSNAGADQINALTCGSTQVTLAANTPTVGTGQWSVVSGTGGFFNNISIPTPIFNGVAGNTYTFRWTISNSPCTASADDVVITFNQNPTTANAGPDQIGASTCGQTSVTLAANSPTIGTGQWSIVSGAGGNITDINNPTSTFSGTAGSTYTLRWTVSNNPCTASSDDVIITFNQNPTLPLAGSDQTGAATCGTTQVTLAANTPSIGSGLWSIVSGAGGSFGNANNATSTFSGIAGNTYTLRWTTSNAPCTALSDDVVVTFNQNPTASGAGADQINASTCGLTQLNLSANNPSIGTGQWSIVSGTGGSFGNASNATSSFSGTAGSTYTLRWTVSNSPCTASADDVIITFNQNPTSANAGPDQTDASTCGLTQVTLAANTPSIGTGQWSIVSGTGGNITDINNPTSTFSGTAGSTYTLRWTVSNSPCTASSDDVIITFNQNPSAASAGTDQTGATTCGLNQVTLNAAAPAIGTGTWSVVSGTGGSFGNVNSPTSTFNGTPGVSYTLRWTTANTSTTCASSFDDVDIKFNQNPTTSNAGADRIDVSTCGLTQISLAANTPTVGTGQWSIVSGAGGSFADASNATSTFSGTAGSTYTLRWTVSNNPCTVSADDVIVTFNQNPTTANAGTDQTGASTCGLTQVNLVANTPTIGTGQWTIVSGTGGSIGSATNAATTFDGIAGNNYTLRWTITNGAICNASTDDVNITFNQNPTTPLAGADQTDNLTCGLTQVTLAANAPTVGTGSWSIVNGTGGSITNTTSPTSTFNGLSGNTYTLRWTVSNAPCTALTDDVVVTFNQSPTTANAGADQTGAATCGLTQVTLAANNPTVGTGVWSVVSGTGGSFVNASSPTSAFNGVAGNTYTLRWTISNSCGNSADDVTVTFNQIPTTAAAGPDQTGASTCGLTQVNLVANTLTAGSGQWSIVSGTGGTIGNINNANTTFDGTAGSAYTLRWTVSTGGVCSNSTDEINITFNQNPTTANAGADQIDAATCGLTQVTLAANTPTVGTGAWTIVSGTGGSFANAASPTSLFNGVAGNTYTLRWTISNNPCTASSDDVVVTFNQNPTTANAGADQTDAATCGLTQVTLAANTPTVGTGIWTIVSGTGGSFANTTSPTSLFNGVAGNTYTLRWTISNNPCTSSSDDVVVTFNQNPTTANAGADQTGNATCGLTQVNLVTNTPAVGNGQWSIVSGAGGTIGNINNAFTTFDGIAGSSYTLRWTVSTGGVCANSTDDINITFNQNPTTANAGADQIDAATCGRTQVTLAANAATAGTGNWSIISGTGGSFANAASPNSSFNGIAGNTYTLRWTISNNPCTASSDDVVITFNQNPTTANAGADQTDAATCGRTQVNLTANTASVGTGQWSIVSGSGGAIGNSNNAATTFDGTAGNTYTLRWAITNGAICSASSDDVTITFNQAPTTANAGADQTGAATCGLTQVNLIANTPAVGNGQWSIVSGTGGTIGNSNNASTTFDGIAGSAYTLRWTVSTGGICANSTDDINIIFNQNPTIANAGADQIDASTCGRTQVTLAANAATVGTGAWSIISGTGGSFANAASPTSLFNGVAGNTYTLRWTISNNPCTASSDDVVVTFNQNPTTANAGADQTDAATCGRTQVNLTANTASVGTGQWSIVSGTGGSIGNSSNSATTFDGTAGNTYTLRWTITNGAICAPSSDDVTITFNQAPTRANAGVDQTDASTCGLTQVALTANTPTIGTGQWSIVSGAGGNFVNASSATTSFNGVAGSTYTLRWTTTNGSFCPSSTDDMIVTFRQIPTAANAGADQTSAATCGLTQVTLAANTPTVGTGVWTIVSGTGGSFTNAASATSNFNGVSGTTYTLRWTVSNNPCIASSDDVVVTFNQNPPAPAIVVSQQPDCFIATGTVTVNNPTGTNFNYSRDGVVFQTSPQFAGLTPGNYTITVRDNSNGCISSAASPAITAQPTKSPEPSFAASDTYCQGETTRPLTAIGNNLRWYTSPTGGTAQLTPPSPSSVNAGTLDYYVTQELTGFCESPRKLVQVVIYPAPVAEAGPDKQIIEGQTVQLDGTASGTGITILWTPGTGLADAGIARPRTTLEQTTTYTLTVTSQQGCVSRDQVTVTVIPPKEIRAANAFTPNGDGFNDRWIIENIEEYPNAVVQVFNRLGAMVFERRGYTNGSGWDGKFQNTDLPIGPYYFVIKLNTKRAPVAGTISIIR